MTRVAMVIACAAAAFAAVRIAPSLLVSASELAALMNDPSAVVLHVADDRRVFEEGHVPGAAFVKYADFAVDGPGALGAELPPLAQLERVFEAAGVSDSSRVIVYGSSPVAAARAFFTLDAIGVARVALLDGGLKAWRAEGRQVETGAGRPRRPGRLTPRLDPRRIADAAFVLERARRHPATALIDVRPDPEFLGTGGGQAMHPPGHIDGARQLPWTMLVASDGRFLPRDALDAKLRAAGAAAGTTVVPYCMVGMRASVVYFVARHLGYDARLYDGSVIDWSQRGLPLKTGRP